MKTVKVYFANGDHLITGINGTAEEIEFYYVNNVFNIGTGGNDNMQKCTKIEFIN
jgi:hypothetical protein